MLPDFNTTVSALADSIMRERCKHTAPEAPMSADSVARFLLELHSRMPDYLRLPLKWLTLVFDAWSVPVTGRPFHRLPHERRWRQIEAWKASSLVQFRDLIKFYESLTVFGWYSEVYRQDHSYAVSRPEHHLAEQQ